MGSGSISRVWVGFGSGSGRVRVAKKLGFPRVLGSFVFPTTSLLIDGFGYHFSDSGRVQVAKKSGFSPGFQVFGYPNPSLVGGRRRGKETQKAETEEETLQIFANDFLIRRSSGDLKIICIFSLLLLIGIFVTGMNSPK